MRDLYDAKSKLKRLVNSMSDVFAQEHLTFSDLVRASSNPIQFLHARIEALEEERAKQAIKNIVWILCQEEKHPWSEWQVPWYEQTST